MPLVVPEVNSGDKNEWLSKLAGKTITEGTSDVTVCFPFPFILEMWFVNVKLIWDVGSHLRRRICPSLIEFLNLAI